MQMALVDAVGTPWWMQVTPLGDVQATATLVPPVEPLVLAAPAAWIGVRLSDDVVWYVRVDTLGNLTTSQTLPAGNGVAGPLQLYDTLGLPWGLTVTSTGDVQLRSGLLASYEDGAYTRFCPIHRVAFDADPHIYRDAGRCCPVGGERLVGYLQRFRDLDGIPAESGYMPDSWRW